MSDKKQETIADTIAWLRRPREGENAYLTAWRDEIADHLEAAHKRELGDCAKLREALKSVIHSMESEAIYNCTEKKRLGKFGQTQEDLCEGCRRRSCECWTMTLKRECEAALAAPPRNCDRFNSGDCNKDVFDASLAWDKFCAEHYPPGTPVVPKTPYTFWSWVFAPATEQKGGDNENE